MRKTTIVITLLLLSCLFYSCKKEYSCTCKHPFTSTYTQYIDARSKTSAKNQCADIGKRKGDPLYDGPYDCVLQ